MKTKITLKFGDKDLTFSFGLSFLEAIHSEEKKNISEILTDLSQNTHVFLPKLMYKSYVHNLDRQNIKPNHTLYDFLDLLEENGGVHEDGGNADIFFKVFLKSLNIDLGEDKENTKEVEKKN